MLSYLHGICKKEYKKKMQPFKGMPFVVEDQEYGYNVGDSISVSLRDDCAWYDNYEKHVYVVRVNHKNFEMNRQEIEELVDIKFEYKSYNACIKNGVPCERLRGNSENDTSRSRQSVTSWCHIGWEVGRGMCSGYTNEEKKEW